MLKVWISGANGHLGQALCTRLDREKYQLIATDVAEVPGCHHQLHRL